MKSDKTLYINLMIPLALTLICYVISLFVFYYKMEPKPILYVFYPFIITKLTLVFYLFSRWLFTRNNWIITALGILFSISIFLKFHWNVM